MSQEFTLSRGGGSQSPMSDTEDGNTQNDDNSQENASQSLLDPEPTGNVIQLTETQLTRIIKRAMEPQIYETKRVRMKCEELDKKLTTVLPKLDSLQKQVKELKSELNKGTLELGTLLTGDGIQKLKLMSFRNMDCKAKDENETELVTQFLVKCKEEGWLLNSSAKGEKDLVQNLRTNRNYLKAQVRLRVFEDISNKTPNHAIKLSKTMKFLREHIGVAELSDYCLLILYNYAYTLFKYANKLNGDQVERFTEVEKAIHKKATDNIWSYVMDRVQSDRDARPPREAAFIKGKVHRMMEAGASFEPLKTTP